MLHALVLPCVAATGRTLGRRSLLVLGVVAVVAVLVSGAAFSAGNEAPTVTDRALAFDGTDLVVVAPQASLVMASTLTIEATVQRTGALGANQIIVNKEGEYEIGDLG